MPSVTEIPILPNAISNIFFQQCAAECLEGQVFQIHNKSTNLFVAWCVAGMLFFGAKEINID